MMYTFVVTFSNDATQTFKAEQGAPLAWAASYR
jgi:hypothetical protein